jgi:N-acyl-L-homoserine lactone synthetase
MIDSTDSILGASSYLRSMQPFCRMIGFESGAVLRRKGHHYRDMYLITDGWVNVESATVGAERHAVRGAGSPIGEIGFLRGCPATATVTARTAAAALLIDDTTLARLEREQPALTTDMMRHLAETAEERASYNFVLSADAQAFTGPQTIEVYLCRSNDMLERAQRLRYEVYCEELRRQSPHADHDKRIISDHLDETALTFIAVEGDETIGTLRGNRSVDGPLGIFEELYGMRTSPRHPEQTAICTKFVVKKSKRGSLASIKLISAMVRYGLLNHVRECYIDCIPALLPYYKAIGFKIVGEKFFHRENGPSYPMMLNLAAHGERLSQEAGVREYLSLIVKAQAIRLIDGLRGHTGSVATR